MARNNAVAPRYEQILSEDVLDRLSRGFRSMNRWMVLMWRLGLGRWAEAWPAVGGRILVIEHRGRKSGDRYRTPLNFTPDGQVRYCLAGFGKRSDWYRNALAADRIVVWLPDSTWTARALDVTDDDGARDRFRSVLIDSGLAARAMGLNPVAMTDEQVDAATAGYRLVRVDLIDRLDENPADLAWMWLPFAAGAATGLGLVARARRR